MNGNHDRVEAEDTMVGIKSHTVNAARAVRPLPDETETRRQKMKKLLLLSILFMFALIVPMPAMAGADIDAGVYLVADVNTDTPQGGLTGRDEKQPDQALEREKPAGSEHKSDFIINVWPVKPQDNVKSLHEMKEENKHTPPDRF